MKLDQNDKSILFSNTEIPDVFFTEYLPCADGDYIKVYLDDKELIFGNEPEMVNDRIMAPVSDLCTSLGIEVMVEDISGVAVIKNGNDIIYIPQNQNWVMVNNEKIDTYLPAYVSKNSIMVPIRYIAEISGYNIEWNQDLNSVYMTKREA